MLDLFSGNRIFFRTGIGRCAKCMRQSLTAALAAWVAFGAASLAWPGSLATTAFGLSAVVLTGLWILHVAARATREAAQTHRSATGPQPAAARIGRRRAMGVFLRAAGIGLLASVPVASWSTAALAFCGQCTKNDDCGYGYECKNTAAVNSGDVCNECVKS